MTSGCISTTICLLIFTCSAGVQTAVAQSGGWTSIGPQGGAAYQIVTDPHDPSIVYAGTTVGVFKSTDGGYEWFASNAGLPLPGGFKDYSAANGPYVYALAIDPQNSNTLYASITYVNYYGVGEPFGPGVYRSDDSGGSWYAANGGINGVSVTALAIDAQTPTTLYAIAWLNPYVYRRVYRSTNGLGWSATFELKHTPPVPTYSPPVATDPHSSGTVYAGDGSRVFKSTNGGTTWADMSDGLPGGFVTRLVIDDVDSSVVYACAGSVYKSINGGQSWQPASMGIIGSVNALVKVSGAQTLYAATSGGSAVFKSIDGAATWTAVNGSSIPPFISLAVNPHDPETLYAGTDGSGLHRSEDGGRQWTRTAFSNIRVFSLAVGADGAVFAGDETRQFRAFPDPAFPCDTAWSSVYKRQAAGGWNAAPLFGATFPVFALAADPTSPDRVYAGTGAYPPPGNPPRCPAPGGVYRSANGGASFGPPAMSLGYVVGYALAIDPVNPNNVYATGLKSVDAGHTWLGLGISGSTSLIVDPQTPATLYSASGDVSKSGDYGGIWTKASDGLGDSPYVLALAIDPQSPSTLYAAVSGRGVFKTNTGGEGLNAWVLTNSGLPPSDVVALAVDPNHPSLVFAGTWGNGVFMSSDGGANWMAMNGPLSTLLVRALVFDPGMLHTLYAGTDGGGVFSTTITPQFVLTVSKTERGEATVTSDDGGVSCGTDCAEAYPVGTAVTLTATARRGAVKAWIGCDTDSGPGRTSTCTVSMDAARTVFVEAVGAPPKKGKHGMQPETGESPQ